MSAYERTRRCPDDGIVMDKVRSRGVIIDECPECGNILLDRGELPEIIRQLSSKPGFNPSRHSERSHDHDDYEHGHHGSHRGHRRRREDEGLFDDIFDGPDESSDSDYNDYDG